MKKSFICSYCKNKVEINMRMGVSHRNHCPFCLWSKHVDRNIAGDRDEPCQGMMEPVGLTFKKVKPDKFGKEKIGELMLVHRCRKCVKISINRIASDDDPKEVLKIFEKSFLIDFRPEVEKEGIRLLSEKDKDEVDRQLFGIK